ncbi:MAG: acylphosphatase [Bdellovibrionia bacterium]
MTGKHILVAGKVQGVGFRYFTAGHANRLGLTGWTRNLTDGRVEILAFGQPSSLQSFLDVIREGPPYSEVSGLVVSDAEATEVLKDFSIRPNGGGAWPEK